MYPGLCNHPLTNGLKDFVALRFTIQGKLLSVTFHLCHSIMCVQQLRGSDDQAVETTSLLLHFAQSEMRRNDLKLRGLFVDNLLERDGLQVWGACG